MKQLTQYDSDFYNTYVDGSFAAARTILPAVFEIVRPKSVVDVGCGLGTWLRAAMQNGISDFLGVDGDYVERDQLRIPAENFQAHDLTKSLELGRRFDLAMTLEVAEHLPPSSAADFVASLVRLAPVVLFSAAIPLQGGTDHVNEQWPAYWAQLFRRHDYHFWDCLRMRFWQVQGMGSYYYRQNLFLIGNRDFFVSRGLEIPSHDPVPLVHPELWMRRAPLALTLTQRLPPSVRRVGRPIKKKVVRLLTAHH